MKFKKRSMAELKRLDIATYQEQEKQPLVVVLDNVRSALNVGSTFRTSDAFGIKKVILCGITCQPPHREINKTALGASDSVAWEHFDETKAALEVLRAEGYKIVAVEQTLMSTSLEQFEKKTTDKLALIFGNEVKGVSQEALQLCDETIEIPQWGTKHSLNISVSVGVCLWHLIEK